MPDTKISALSAATTLAGTETLPVVQGGATVKATVTQVLAASLDLAGTKSMTGALNYATTVTIASAATVNIGAAASNAIIVSGVTTITAFDTIAAGAERSITFSGALTLTHNATSLILPGGANITTAAGDCAEFVSLGAGNWRCTSYSKASGTAVVSSGGALTNFTEAVNTAAPNATVPVVSLTATNAATNVDAALAPKGTGGIAAQIADNTATGGNKRGINHVDLQTERNANTQVASGVNATIVGGRRNTVAGSYATAGGNTCSASGVAATAFGQSLTASGAAAFAAGDNCTASGAQSVAMGNAAQATSFRSVAIGNAPVASGADSFAFGCAIDRGLAGGIVYARTSRAAAGDRNHRLSFPLCAVTTNATTTTLTTDASAESAANTLLVPNNHTVLFAGWVIARNTANNDSIAWKFEGMASRDGTAASVTLLGAVTPATVGTADAGMSTCTLAVTVNTTNGTVIVQFTGIAATTIAINGAMTPVIENG